jgi:hypothetical protein
VEINALIPHPRQKKPTVANNQELLTKRNTHPKLLNVGLEWVAFQVLRKANASLSKKAGVDPKVASTGGATDSASAWRSTPVRTWGRSEPRSRKLEAALLRKPQPQQPSELAKSA